MRKTDSVSGPVADAGRGSAAPAVAAIPLSTPSRREFLLGLLATGATATGAALSRGAAWTRGRDRRTRFTTPIEHVVICVRENRSYDNVFGRYPGANGVPEGEVVESCPDVVNPDPGHDHRKGIANLTNNGVTAPQANCVYDAEDVPAYFDLADQFTLCDNYFTEIIGPTVPNHLVLFGARPAIGSNPASFWECPLTCYEMPTLADRAELVGLTWKHYGGTPYDIVPMIEHMRDSANNVLTEDWYEDVAAGTLPNLSWLKVEKTYNEHPPAAMSDGQNWMADQVNALMVSPQWDSSLMVILWDDWGGFYDHVVPPNVETLASFGDQFRYGYRSGCLVVSPYSRPGYVSSTLYSHASIVALVNALFDLEPLTDLDRHANNMLDCFDFNQPPRRNLRPLRKVQARRDPRARR